ncbi:hypothetical protein K504DRAFT_95510 [Pleomassaria siparia CBS 279.74]|uniref:Uncharacterized protein n=1 Tax=Pleomassaria siparia CBS 279.74 TaxID=1314801 RepID=A0A6G1JZK2_9PLEO|nr:hypothetical protein K504DRAFT_95510 [Pleomassaria siparia CBS 279.74]
MLFTFCCTSLGESEAADRSYLGRRSTLTYTSHHLNSFSNPNSHPESQHSRPHVMTSIAAACFTSNPYTKINPEDNIIHVMENVPGQNDDPIFLHLSTIELDNP